MTTYYKPLVNTEITLDNYESRGITYNLKASCHLTFVALYDTAYNHQIHEFDEYNTIQLTFSQVELLYNKMKKLQEIN